MCVTCNALYPGNSKKVPDDDGTKNYTHTAAAAKQRPGDDVPIDASSKYYEVLARGSKKWGETSSRIVLLLSWNAS